MYRLIVADLDGTLKSESNPSFTPRVLDAVRRAQERGVHVVMATGRMFRTAERFISELGLQEFAVCDHGATIYDLQSKKVVFEKRVPMDYVARVAEFAGERHTLTACADGEMYTNRILGDEPKRHGDIAINDHLHLISDFRALESEPQKLLFLQDEQTTPRVFAEMKTRFGSELLVMCASTRRVELIHREASKGVAAAWLAARWGILREQVIGIGDQDNDRSLIAWAGLGVAMGNAIADVKAIAKYIAPSADDDGAAHVIEKFVLNSL